MPPVLTFDRGTLLLEGLPEEEVPPAFVYDDRVHLHRAPAMAYHDAVWALHRRKQPWEDRARAYGVLERPHRTWRQPRHYQEEALAAWNAAGRRGVVVLPTGAGKTLVAELCITAADRDVLVVAPTLELVAQWYATLVRAFGEPVGILGGGRHEVHAITVSTYDSAWMLVERYGDRFGLLVFDEVHHLPSPSYALAASCSIAPWRLGLTATLERPDGDHEVLRELIGPVVYARSIRELAGDFLAPYRTEVLDVFLSDEERAAYEQALATYRLFRESRGIGSGRGGFQHFLREAGRSREGREAFAAFRESRRIVHQTPRKLELLGEILAEHAGARCIVFTNDNATAWTVSRTFLVPAITHRTDPKERRVLLDAFADGSLPVLATSRVLNEGVDVPEAEVAIVMSGTGTVREHVQRLGRILRPVEGKQAVLYELVVAGTVEERTSARRRDHEAWQGDGG
ncbi:MAG: DEAD/DEAH box helicase family protein [Myxococcales bacterium]|nr:DEAD/DEAH box helicase family protein [Myxococcales bacterium]